MRRIVWQIVWLCCSTAAPAQVTIDAGVISGTVLDPQRLPVANAKVTVTGRADRSTLSESDGTFRLSLLPPGRYSVATEAPGFARQVQEGVEVVVGETVTLEFALSAGQQTYSVNVNA